MATPISVGNAKSDAGADRQHADQLRTRKLGSVPEHERPPRQSGDEEQRCRRQQPTPSPNRAISRLENSSDTIGTMSGPGAIAMPIFSADQPQIV